MLKIKDNVDLKELEKFGFVYNANENIYEYISKSDEDYKLIVWKVDREINFYYSFELWRYCTDEDETMCKLFDLIQAGLVEKVVADGRV